MNVLVAGGSGFVGRSLCRVLLDRGHGVTALSRSPITDGLPDGVETRAADITSDTLTGPVADHDAVVNLVALPAHVQPSEQSHEVTHVQGTRRLIEASERAGIERFVQMSALGVDSGIETAYFDAKRRAEQTVRESSLSWVIYRPSVVFGDGCGFLSFLERWLPPVVAPFPGGGEMQIQPIWVEDLAPMLADGVEEKRHVGNAYELGGPEALSLAAVIELVCPDRTVLSVPMPVAKAGLSVAELFPDIPLGHDQFRVLAHDNTVESNDVVAFRMAESDLRTLSAHLDA